MLTAIINARCNSSRLPFKHFKKIGNKTVIELIIDALKENKFIKEIYVATGSYSKNKKFKQELNYKYKNLKFFFYDKEEHVTERIFKLSKKISTEYCVLISGDCVLIDNSFITRMYKKLSDNKDFDFIKASKKVQHEGIKIFKTEAWGKVNRLSKNNIFQENPGYITKIYPKKFKILKLIPQKYESGKSSRLSIDTKSDLDFFELIYQFLKKKNKKFNFQNSIKYNCLNRFKYINRHVSQKDPQNKNSKRIIIITCANKKFGIGHYRRSGVIEREILERFTSNIEKVLINSKKIEKNKLTKYLNLNEFLKYKFNNKNYFIIDLPNEILERILNKISKLKRLLIIDNKIHLKKAMKIIPSMSVRSDKKKNFFAGKEMIILNRDIIKILALKKIRHFVFKENIITVGGTFYKSNELEKLLEKQKNIKIILGPHISQKQRNYFIKKLSSKNIIYNPKNIFEIFANTRKIYSKFGVTTYECISLNLKPIVFYSDEIGDRLKEIKYLKKHKFINLFNNKIINESRKINIIRNLFNISKILEKFIYGSK